MYSEELKKKYSRKNIYKYTSIVQRADKRLDELNNILRFCERQADRSKENLIYYLERKYDINNSSEPFSEYIRVLITNYREDAEKLRKAKRNFRRFQTYHELWVEYLEQLKSFRLRHYDELLVQ